MEWQSLFRLFIAAILGFIIGFERKERFKEAGLRTHSIVSLGACLMMLISMYAFDSDADKARVAAQIVSGIGFLGAGMIMFKEKGGVQGLTTAAGIWVTAGIGMAIGAGKYIIGCGATVMIIAIQFLLHLPIKFLKTKRFMKLKIIFKSQTDENERIKELFHVETFSKVKVVKEEGKVLFTTVLTTDKMYDDNYLNNIIKENDFISSIERIDE